MWHRLDEGEVSDGESTATASDVDMDIDNSLPASATTDSADKRETLRTDDNDSAACTASLLPAKPLPYGAADLSERESETAKAKDKPLLDRTSMPTVRLERLSLEPVPKVLQDAQPVVHKQTLADEHNYYSMSEPPPVDDRRKSPPSSRPRVDSDIDDSVDVVDVAPPAPVPTLPPSIAIDHCYCVPFLPSFDVVRSPPSLSRQRRTKRRLSDVTNVPGSRELSSLLPPAAIPPPRPRYEPRDLKAEIMTLLEFILAGVDAEDIVFLRRRYEQLLQFDSSATDWLNDTHWVDHPTTFFTAPQLQPLPRKRRKVEMEDWSGQHLTGQSASRSALNI